MSDPAHAAARARAAAGAALGLVPYRRDLATGATTWLAPEPPGAPWREALDLAGDWVERVIHAEDRDAYRDAVARARAGDGALRCTYRARRRDGVPLWLEDAATLSPGQGGALELIGCVADVTARSSALAAARTLELRLAETSRLAGLGHFDWDLRGGQPEGSPELHRLIGTAPEENPLEWFLARVHPEDRDKLGEAIDGVRRGGSTDTVYRIMSADGETRTVRTRAASACDAAGTPVRIFGTTQDVTDVMRTEQELRRSLEEKSALVREVVHRVKNNLQVVTSLLSLQARAVSDPGARRIFELTRDRVGAMALVHDLLYESGNVSRVDCTVYVQQLVGAVARTWQPDAERVQVRVRIGPGITHADLDTAVPGGLIVTELVTNAFKHAFPGDRRGALTVSLSLTNDGRRRLEVTDDGVGPGAAPDRRPDQERLGLTLVRSLVYQLHGEMAILPGEPGTRVVIEFPATRC